MRGSRWVPYQSFHTGYKEMIMQPDELLGAFGCPASADLHHYYRKVGTQRKRYRRSALPARQINEGVIDLVRIALGSIAPVPLRCPGLSKPFVERRSVKVLLRKPGSSWPERSPR